MGQKGLIGLESDELECVRILLRLLRHQDPVVAELTRRALAYLALVARRSSPPKPEELGQLHYIQ